MFTRTIRTVQAIAFVFISFAASAQAYHHPIRIDETTPRFISDSGDVSRLQLSVIQQPDSGSMKFRVVVINPFEKGATITISKGDDTFFAVNGVKGAYQNLFDLSQLEDGNYEIIVSTGWTRIHKEINIHTEVRTDRKAQLN